MKIKHLTLLLSIIAFFAYAQNSSTLDPKNPLNYYPDFAGKIINTNSDIISLDVPKRAEDPAFVPLKINIGQAQKDLFIKKIWVFVDNNPIPLVGLFEFGEASEYADLAFKIRINEHSFVRAIALTNDNELYQSSSFVKASGGCSAPIGSDLIEAKKRLGEMRLNSSKDVTKLDSTLINLKIRHINLTGMQMDQVSRLRPLPHYVKKIEVSLDGKTVFLADTTFSISENPNFRFYMPNGKNKQFKIKVLDTESSEFIDYFSL